MIWVVPLFGALALVTALACLWHWRLEDARAERDAVRREMAPRLNLRRIPGGRENAGREP